MADNSPGKSIRDAYNDWTGDTDARVAAQPSRGAAIRDAYGTQAAETPTAPTPQDITIDPTTGAPMVTSTAAQAEVGAAFGRALGRIGSAAAEGWTGVPAIPRVPGDLVTSPIYNPLIAGAETALRAGGAAFRGLQQTAVEATPDIHLPSLPPGVSIPLGGNRSISGELTPGPLGREIAALPEAFPFGFNALRPPAGRPPIPEAPPSPRFVQEFYGEGTPTNPLAAAPPGERPAFVPPGVNIPPRPVEPPAFVPPTEPPPATPASPPPAANPLQPEAAQPSASPTAAPSARVTPIVTQAQAEAEADRILRHFAGDQPVIINSGTLASGAQPTLSQSVEGGHGGLAALERGVRDVPEQTQHFVARETGNTTLRNKAVGEVIGDSRATDVTEAELNARTRPQEAAIFDPTKTKPVDPADTIAAIDDVLNGPQGQRDVVKSSLQHVRDKLVDKDGKLQTDPALLRGVDLSIGDMIGPKAAGTAHDGRQAAHQLMAVRDNLRSVIEQGAPGYQDFLAQQAAERSAIDGQRFLQARNITDRQGNINLGTLDSTIKAAESQQRLPGARLADGVTDEQLARLKELRADYQNDAKQRLGTSIGSPTVQKLGVSGSMGVMGHPLLAGGAGVAGAWAAGASNPLLGAVLGGAGYLMRQQSLKGQRMVMDALRDKLLNPEKARSAFAPP